MKYLTKIFLSNGVINLQLRICAIFLIISILISTFLEMLGIGMIIPIINSIFNENYISNFGFLIPNESLINKYFGNNIIYYMLFLFFFIYLFKSLYLFFHNFFLSWFIKRLVLSLQLALVKKYLNKSYSFFQNINSSVIVRNMQTEVGILCNKFIISFFTLITEVAIFIAIYFLIFFINKTIGNILILAAFFLTTFYYFFVFKKLGKWGKIRQHFSSEILRSINSIIFAIKEIKLLNKESFFFEKLKINAINIAKSQFIKSLVNPIPRLCTEIFLITVFCLTIIFMLENNYKSEDIITLLALSAATVFRILPSLNRINAALNEIKYSSSSAKIIYDELTNKLHDDQKSKYLFDEDFYSMNVKGLSFSYGNKKILDKINFSISKNQNIGIIGESGVGKTTFINILMGLQKSNFNNLQVNNNEFTNFKILQQKIAYVPQDIYLLDDTIEKNIAFDNDIDQQKVVESSKNTELFDFILSQKKKFKSIVGENGVKLSGGQKQRIGIARALYSNKEILILDEVTSSLDNRTEKKFLMFIKNLLKNKTIIFVTHRKEPLKICDKVYEIKNKKLYSKK